MAAQSASYYPSGHDPGKPDARDPHVRFDMSDGGPGTIGTSSDPTYPWAFERELKGSNALVFPIVALVVMARSYLAVVYGGRPVHSCQKVTPTCRSWKTAGSRMVVESRYDGKWMLQTELEGLPAG